jgi:hypothetical protein
MADWVKFKLRSTLVPCIRKCLTAQYAAMLCALILIGSLLMDILHKSKRLFALGIGWTYSDFETVGPCADAYH